jgi:hypothetical protein
MSWKIGTLPFEKGKDKKEGNVDEKKMKIGRKRLKYMMRGRAGGNNGKNGKISKCVRTEHRRMVREGKTLFSKEGAGGDYGLRKNINPLPCAWSLSSPRPLPS